MRYLGTDYLYNLEELYHTHQHICENGTELYLLFPINNGETTRIAVSRELLFRRFGVRHIETEYDVFEIVSPINYHIEGENVIIENELNVLNQLSQFAHSVHTLLSSFGSNVYIGNAENRTNIMRLINADRNAALIEPRENDEVNLNWNLQLLYEQRYFIPYVQGNGSKNVAVVTVTSNRGLAGGYNANIIKLVTSAGFEKENVRVYSVGKKGADGLARRGYQVVTENPDYIEEPTYAQAQELGRRLLNDYANGEIGEIYVAYTEFKNTVTHIPKLIKLLPAEAGDVEVDEEMSAVDKITPMNFEPSEEEAIALLIPKYVASILYGAFVEAVASENGARMQAMDSATNNAEEIISDLELKYNRARQGAITQELTEIIAGANAIG